MWLERENCGTTVKDETEGKLDHIRDIRQLFESEKSLSLYHGAKIVMKDIISAKFEKS